jgi:hypothetical protein
MVGKAYIRVPEFGIMGGLVKYRGFGPCIGSVSLKGSLLSGVQYPVRDFRNSNMRG